MTPSPSRQADLDAAAAAALGHERLADDVARRLLETPALPDLGLAAGAMRRRLHPGVRPQHGYRCPRPITCFPTTDTAP